MDQNKLDYALLLRKALKHWYVFFLSLAISVAGAYALIKYKHPEYRSSALVLVEDEKDSKQLTQEAIFADLGLMDNGNNLLNEMMVLTSSPLLRQVVEKLELHHRYFQIDGIISRELYKNTPVEVLSWEPQEGYGGFYGVLEADNAGGFVLELDDKSLGDNNRFSGEFGKSLKLPSGTVTISNRENTTDFGQIGVLVSSVDAMVGQLRNGLSVELTAKGASVLKINMQDLSPERIRDVLTTLVEVHNQFSIDKKNSVFKNTIDLINDRIDLMISELSAAEQDVQEYKQRFSMTELSAEGTMLMTEVSSYSKEIAVKELQLDILSSIENFLEKNRNNFEFVPTNASITDLTLVNQIQSFNALLADRERKRSDLGPSHPDLIVVEKQIRNLRETIVESIQSIKKDLTIALDANQNVKGNLQTRLQTLPRRERELVEIERRKGVKENLYIYLLQKREEAAIALAATTAQLRVVEPAYVPTTPVSPNKIQIMVTALFLGMAIPSGIVFLLFFLNNKIQAEDDLERATTVPMVGVIAQSRKKARLVVHENSRSMSAETFRMLRANLSYIASGKEMKTVLVTSGISGEGKSFISLNLGVVQALAGKRVIILELDLRKPKQELYGEANLKKINEHGVVNYLIDHSLSAEDIITNSGAHPNLDIIRCGPKPPNPSELILSTRLRELMSILNANYDFIILDAPPVGLVADPLQMKDLADATMFVLRAGYSRKPELQLINDIVGKDKLPNPFIVLNGVRSGGSYGGSYGGYGYGYGYGHQGYYEEEQPKSIWRRWFGKKERNAAPIQEQTNQRSQNGAHESKKAAKVK